MNFYKVCKISEFISAEQVIYFQIWHQTTDKYDFFDIIWLNSKVWNMVIQTVHELANTDQVFSSH